MEPDKYTDRARGFVQAAQGLAQREDHQQFTPRAYFARLAGRRTGAGCQLNQRL